MVAGGCLCFAVAVPVPHKAVVRRRLRDRYCFGVGFEGVRGIGLGVGGRNCRLVGIGFDLGDIGVAVGVKEDGWSRRSRGVGFRHMGVGLGLVRSRSWVGCDLRRGVVDLGVGSWCSWLVAGVGVRCCRVVVLDLVLGLDGRKHRMRVGRRMGVAKRGFESMGAGSLGGVVDLGLGRGGVGEGRCRRCGMFRWVGRMLEVLNLNILLVDWLRVENSHNRYFHLVVAITALASTQNRNINPSYLTMMSTKHSTDIPHQPTSSSLMLLRLSTRVIPGLLLLIIRLLATPQ